MYWLHWLLQRAYRQVLWGETHESLSALHEALGGTIRPRQAGWEVRSPRGRVWVHTGLGGVRTDLWRTDGVRRRVAGPPPADSLQWLDSTIRTSPSE